MLSGPSTLAFLICLMALMFFISGTVTFVGRPLCYRLNGTDLFRNSSKCFTSLICFFLTSVTDFSCLFLTGCSDLLHFLTSFLIVSFGCLTCPFLPVCFIVFARSFTYFNLVFFFTRMFASVPWLSPVMFDCCLLDLHFLNLLQNLCRDPLFILVLQVATSTEFNGLFLYWIFSF